MEVAYTPAFIKQLGHLENGLQQEVIEKIELFKEGENHRQLKVHKLHGHLSGRYSFAVNYKFRIIFSYLSKKEALFLAVGDHDVYKN